jgi:TonB family protein
MKNCILLVLLLASLCGCHKGQTAGPVAAAPAIQLPAPQQLSPGDSAALHGFPRLLRMKWTAVRGASKYGLEVDCYGCCASHNFCSEVRKPTFVTETAASSYTHEFVGDQPGRWRVWAISADGLAGVKSGWRSFTYGRVYDGNLIPPPIPAVAPSDVVRCPARSYPTPTPGAAQPTPIYVPDPEYSDAARQDKVTGTVALQIRIGEDGMVKDACVLRSLRPDLDANAVAAVKTWRFQPARKDNVPIPATINVETTFALK